MKLLSQVAETGRIVLVATHAMESVERAQALCVLVGGHVAFFGPPRKALSYFRVDRYADLFPQLEKQSPSAWHVTAKADPDQQVFLRRPGPALRSPAAQAGEARGQTGAKHRFRAWVHYIRGRIEIDTVSRMNDAILLNQPVELGSNGLASLTMHGGGEFLDEGLAVLRDPRSICNSRYAQHLRAILAAVELPRRDG